MALVALALAWWLTGRPFTPNALAATDAVAAHDVQALADVVSDPRRAAVDLPLDSVPDAASRAVLHAARQAGVAVVWWVPTPSGSLPALAISTAALADPAGGTRVRVTGRDSAPAVLEDSLGWLDSATVLEGGVQWPVTGELRAFSVNQLGTHGSVGAPAKRQVGRVRLYAAPGWEARFVMDALEEAGWEVDAQFGIAPRVTRTAGAPAALDTARYAVVIALDSVAWSSAPAIARFVADGGGLLLFPDAAAGRAFASLRVATPGALLAGVPGGLRTDTPRRGLPLQPLTVLGAEAVVLERSDRAEQPVSVAAARVGAGRVVQAGWASTWEWRMLGGDDAPDAHRSWWRTLVQRAAYAPVTDRADAWSPLPGDAAPLADLVARLGPAQPMAATATRTGQERQAGTPSLPAPAPAWLYAVAALALLGEWWSRRLRGAR